MPETPDAESTTTQNSGGEAAPPALSGAERAELERLRVQVATQNDGRAADPSDGSRAGHWRAPVSTLLIVIFCLLAALSVSGRWARDIVFDTDRYVDTVSPLASDPAIQAAVANKIADATLAAIDVSSVVDQGLQALGATEIVPQRAKDLLPALQQPLVNGIDNFVREQITRVTTSGLFTQAWIEANRQAHMQLVKVLNGDNSGSVSTSNGNVSVNLAAFIATVKSELQSRGIRLASKIPDVQASFTIFQSADLAKAQGAASALDTTATWLPIVALIFLAAGIYVARRRRRAVLGAGIGLIITMAAVILTLQVSRSVYLNALPPDSLPSDAATTLYDTLTRYLLAAASAGLVLGIVMALAAYLSGPSQIGRAVRRGVHRLTDAAAAPLARQFPAIVPAGAWLGSYLTAARSVVIGIGALVIFVWPHPTRGVIWITTLVALIVLLIVEIIARTGRPASEDAEHAKSEAVAAST